MANQYLDKAGLQLLLTKLTEKYEGKFLGLHAIADEAKKVSNALTLNIDGVANTFDGSGAKFLDVAAAEHTHKAIDVSDFATEVKKVVFGDEAAGEMDSHIHENLDVLDDILAADVANWDAKIGVDDVARIKYQNGNMSSVENVKQALDVLAANVVLAAGAMAEADGNMKQLEAAIDVIEGDYLKAADKTELQNKITALEDANKEGGAVAEAIADAQAAAEAAQKDADDNAAAIEVLKGDANTAGSVAKAVKDAVDAQAATQLEKDNAQDQAIAGKVAQSAYDTKVKALEDEDARIAGLVASEAERAAAAEAAALKAGQDAQADVDALEKYVKGDNLDGKGGIEARVAANEAFVAAQPAIDAEQDRRLTALEGKFDGEQSVDAKIEAAEQAAKDYADQKDTADKQAQALIDQEQDRRLGVIEAAIGEDGALESRVAANEAAIDVINGEGEGSIKKAVADLVDGAPAALDTLNELAEALRDNADVLDAVETAFDNKLAAQKTELQKEIDDDITAARTLISAEIDEDVKAEADRAKAEEADIRADFAAADAQLKTDLQKEIDDDVAAEAALRLAEDNKLDARIKAFEAGGAQDVAAFKADYEGRMKAAEDFVAAQPAIDKTQNDRLAALEAVVNVTEGAKSVDEKIADAKQEAIDAAASKDEALHTTISAEIDADVEAEAKLRDDADKALDAKIAAINAADTGILDQAKKYADAQDTALHTAISAEIDQDVKVVADELAKQKDAAQAGTLANRIAAFEANGANDVAAIEQRVKANEDKLAAIGAPMNEADINEVIAAVFQ